MRPSMPEAITYSQERRSYAVRWGWGKTGQFRLNNTSTTTRQCHSALKTHLLEHAWIGSTDANTEVSLYDSERGQGALRTSKMPFALLRQMSNKHRRVTGRVATNFCDVVKEASLDITLSELFERTWRFLATLAPTSMPTSSKREIGPTGKPYALRACANAPKNATEG